MPPGLEATTLGAATMPRGLQAPAHHDVDAAAAMGASAHTIAHCLRKVEDTWVLRAMARRAHQLDA